MKDYRVNDVGYGQREYNDACVMCVSKMLIIEMCERDDDDSSGSNDDDDG